MDLHSALVPIVPADARPVSSGEHDYGHPAQEAPFGRWIPKLDSGKQASGEAQYSSDMVPGALFGQVVFSTSCNAVLKELDASVALGMPGVRDFVTAQDVPKEGENNATNGLDSGAPSLAASWKIFEKGDRIPAVGMPLGLILAETWAQARAAAKQITQIYTDRLDPVITMKQSEQLGQVLSEEQSMGALARSPMQKRLGLQHHFDRHLQRPQPDLAQNLRSVHGCFETSGQSHLFMETNSAVVQPSEGDHFKVWSGNQWPDLCKQAIALALGVPKNCILVNNPRVGGAFGGKIFYQTLFATAAAVAANKHHRAVKVQNERSDDMQMMGNRHPLTFTYDASFETTGKIQQLKVQVDADQGWIAAPMAGMAQAASLQLDNNYLWPSYEVTSCRDHLTNKPANTAMRAPPSMQAGLAGDVVLEHISKSLSMDLDDVMELNFFTGKEVQGNWPKDQAGCPLGDKSEHFNYTVLALWNQMRTGPKVNYEDRKSQVATYNAQNRLTKKGIAITTAKWTAHPPSAYKVSAHVAVEGDGSVVVASGGTEIGQGLNTKAAMAAANALGIPLELVRCADGDTHLLPNNTNTGGSMTSENVVWAVMKACESINASLKQGEETWQEAGETWQEAVARAYGQNIPLVGTFMNDGAWNKRMSKSGDTIPYDTYAACVSEVLVDVLTGDVRVERVDILMDLGNQLNAAVDIGQIEGGFIMALGYLLTEELKVNKDGKLLNLGTWNYKIPTAYDIPVQMNVSLLKDTPNPNGVKSSKAVAEPAMHLISSPYMAVKNAIYAAREDLGSDEWFMLNLPLSPETVQQAINIQASEMVLP